MPLKQLRVAGLVCVLLVAPVFSQSENPPPGSDVGTFFESVDVNLVNVDVVVTDKKGNRIRGLGRDDFEIFEDDRPVKITNFYAVEDGVPTVAPSVTADEVVSLPAQSVPGAPSVPKVEIPPDQQLSLVVYVDNFNIRPFNRNRVFRRLREFLRTRLTDEDRVMLMSYDRSLHVRHPFTTNGAVLAASLAELEDMTGHAIHVDSERRRIMREINEAEEPSEVEWQVRQYAESTYNDLLFTIDHLKRFVDSLAGLPGRKAILYVSDGIPLIAGEEFFYALQARFNQSSALLMESQSWNAQRRYQELTSAANANRVTFYTIDAAGLRAPSVSSVEIAGTPNGPLVGADTFIDSLYISNLQSPLLQLAKQTGGAAILNTNDVGPGLERMGEDFRSYYSLGYLPSHAGDGRRHDIKVKVKNKKWVLRYRRNYRDKSVAARMTDGTMATLNFGFENNPIGAQIFFGNQEPQSNGHYLVEIIVRIPLSKLVLLPREASQEGRLQLFFAARDQDGDSSPVQSSPLSVVVPNKELDPLKESYYDYQVKLMMRRGGHRLGVGIRDDLGATQAFVYGDVDVGRL